MKKNKISIGTRGSKLAMWQAEWVQSRLKNIYPHLMVEILKIKTTGDKILDVPLAKIGGKGLFVKEIEEALLRKKVDIAVHSMKDVPTEFPEGLHLAVICKREDPRDAFLSRIRNLEFEFKNFKALPKGATVGTSSLRRSCQLLNVRPDLRIKHLRGNLDTRIKKLDEGQYDAIVVASAGLKRLKLQERVTEILPFEISLPAIGQGAIGIECRVNDYSTNTLISSLNHRETFLCVMAERTFLRRLGGGCQVPIAAHARIEPDSENPNFKIQRPKLIIDGLVGSITGDRIIRGHIEGDPEKAEIIGIQLADDILSRGAQEILEEVYEKDTSKSHK